MLQDGLGSVRSVVDSSLSPLESRLYEPYGTPFGASGTAQTSYGFTGEMTDTNDLLYLRARYYAPSLGVFTGRDPFEGMAQRPMSLNGYSWVEGNVPNAVDPSGIVPLKIWISAFIEPSTIDFPYFTVIPPFYTPNATWHGDGRSWYSGGTRPSARVWFNFQVDTTDPNTLDWNPNTGSDTGYTEVTYIVVYPQFSGVTGSAGALPPLALVYPR